LGSAAPDGGKGVVVDSSNNIYVSGWTWGGLDGNTSSGEYDAFLVKYDSSGTKQWTKQFGTSESDFARAVAVDSENNIYITGYTKGGLDGNSNSGNEDIFLVKYNSSGTKQWTRQRGTSLVEIGYGIAADSENNIFVIGHTFGGLDGNTNLGYRDVFLIKYNSVGNKLWTKQLGTANGDFGEGVVADSLNNIYISGWTGGSFSGYTNEGSSQDIFLVKYNSNGVKLWTKQFGTSESDRGFGVTVDFLNNVYVTGYTSQGLDGSTYLGEQDIFIQKYNPDGDLQ
jgi:hypothetical protein